MATEVLSPQLTGRQAAKWRRQVDELHRYVSAWTGNPLQAIEMSSFEWADHKRRHTNLFEDISRDAVRVAGAVPAVTVTRTAAD